MNFLLRKGCLRSAVSIAVRLICLTWATALPLTAQILSPTGDTGTHDPTVIKTQSGYFRFSTGPGITVSRSPDLIAWTTAGKVFASNPGWIPQTIAGATDLWAPDIVLVDGVYRLYYSVSTFGSNRSAIGLAIATVIDPELPGYGWKDLGIVVESFREDNFNAIDPNLVTDFSGRQWLAFGSFWSGIKMIEIDRANGKAKLAAGGSGPASSKNANIVPLAERPEAPDAIEGAFILPKDGFYYLFVSFDFCCRGKRSTYNIRVGRAKDIAGPYRDAAGIPMLQGGGTLIRDADERFIGPGHNSILTDGNIYYIVYHAYDARYGGLSKLRIEGLSWDKDGWPQVPSQLTKQQTDRASPAP